MKEGERTIRARDQAARACVSIGAGSRVETHAVAARWMDQIVRTSCCDGMCLNAASRTDRDSDCIRDCTADPGIVLAFHWCCGRGQDRGRCESHLSAQSTPASGKPPWRRQNLQMEYPLLLACLSMIERDETAPCR